MKRTKMDSTEAIYNGLNQKVKEADISHIILQLQKVVDDNIEIGTFSDNMFDIPKEKRIERSRKSNVKYKNEELKNILSFYSESKSYKKTMIKFNISSKGTLWHILNNRKN